MHTFQVSSHNFRVIALLFANDCRFLPGPSFLWRFAQQPAQSQSSSAGPSQWHQCAVRCNVDFRFGKWIPFGIHFCHTPSDNFGHKRCDRRDGARQFE